MAGKGGDNKTRVTLEVGLENKIPQGSKQVESWWTKFRKKIGLDGKKVGGKKDETTTSLENQGKAAKKAGDEVARAEKRKREEYKKTNAEIDKQGKKIKALGQALANNRLSRFLGAFATGSGLSVAGKALTGNAGALLGRGVSRGVGAVLNFGLSGFQQAYQAYVQYGQAQAGMIGLGNRAGMQQGARGAGRAKGARLGYSMIDTAMQAPAIARSTGFMGNVYKAQQFARATGMDVGEVGGYMGMIRQAGYGFGGRVRPGGVDTGSRGYQVEKSGNKVLEKVVAAGIYSGIERARLPEFMQGVASITGAAGARSAGRVDVGNIAAFQAMLGKSGNAGFQGARGAAVAQQLMQATVTPGGGEAGQAMMLQALGFGKPGGQATYYEALKKQQQGMERPENVAAMFKEVYSQLGQVGAGGSSKVNQEANIALNEMTGLSIDQIEKLGDILNNGQNAEEQMKAIKDQLAESEPIEKQALKQMKDFGGTAVRIAGKTDTLIGIGAKTAKYFEKIEQYQMHALKWLAGKLPAIEKLLTQAVKALVELVGSFKAAFYTQIEAFFGDPTRGQKEAQRLYQEYGNVPSAFGKYGVGNKNWREDLEKKNKLLGKQLYRAMEDSKMSTGESLVGYLGYEGIGETRRSTARERARWINRQSQYNQRQYQMMAELEAIDPALAANPAMAVKMVPELGKAMEWARGGLPEGQFSATDYRAAMDYLKAIADSTKASARADQTPSSYGNPSHDPPTTSD